MEISVLGCKHSGNICAPSRRFLDKYALIANRKMLLQKTQKNKIIIIIIIIIII